MKKKTHKSLSNIAIVVRRARQALGISQGDLARAMDVNQSVVSLVEQGRRLILLPEVAQWAKTLKLQQAGLLRVVLETALKQAGLRLNVAVSDLRGNAAVDLTAMDDEQPDRHKRAVRSKTSTDDKRVKQPKASKRSKRVGGTETPNKSKRASAKKKQSTKKSKRAERTEKTRGDERALRNDAPKRRKRAIKQDKTKVAKRASLEKQHPNLAKRAVRVQTPDDEKRAEAPVATVHPFEVFVPIAQTG